MTPPKSRGSLSFVEVPEPPEGTMQPFLLPLTLTPRAVRTTEKHIEIECLVVDARGRSVQFLPLSVDIRTTVAELEAILQSTIGQIAAALYAREAAVLLPPVAMQDAPALQEIVGRAYKGSVAR
jgi:hypothetical protein